MYKLLNLMPIIFLVTNSIFIISNIIYIDVSTASENNLEWSVTLNFDEPGGANNNVFFGEALYASDAQDSYDVPIPPPGIAPYIRPWFDAGLNEPYNSLFYDIKKYPDDSKIWDLYVQWVPSDYVSSNNITISWDVQKIIASEYESVVLYDYNNDIIIANMLIVSNYTYYTSAMVQYHFQIICNTTSSPLNNPPYQPSNPHPQAGAIDIDIAPPVLTWVGSDPDEGDIVKYDVYFGTISTPPKVSNNQSSTSYNIGTLDYNTIYYWKIIAWDDKGLSTEGAVWHFTTESQNSPPQNNPPTAVIKSPQKGYVNQTITFDASFSNDSDGYIQYYRCDFTNDGKWDPNWIGVTSIKYVYSNPGTYTIKLQIKDNGGATNTATTMISIFFIEEGKLPPIADANGPYSGLINQNITFDSSGSYDSDGTILYYTWNFGDGIKNNDEKATHIYTTEGTYNVTLLVVDNDGLAGEATTTAYIFDNDSDEDGWGDNEEIKYGSDPNNSEDFPLDTDKDHIPDSIDDDDDNDGLSDKIEEKLGSDPKNKSDVLGIIINDATHYLIDTNKDGKSELLYNSRSGNTTDLEYKGKNKYLVDEDGDGKWDYLYDNTYGTLTPYREEKSSSFPLFPLIAILLICLFLVIIAVRFFYKKRLQ